MLLKHKNKHGLNANFFFVLDIFFKKTDRPSRVKKNKRKIQLIWWKIKIYPSIDFILYYLKIYSIIAMLFRCFLNSFSSRNWSFQYMIRASYKLNFITMHYSKRKEEEASNNRNNTSFFILFFYLLDAHAWGEKGLVDRNAPFSFFVLLISTLFRTFA